MPPVFEQRLVNKTRYETVPNGTTNCTTYGIGGSLQTTCTSGTKMIAIPYVEASTVDIRETERNAQIEACTEVACWERFGNTACEASK